MHPVERIVGFELHGLCTQKVFKIFQSIQIQTEYIPFQHMNQIPFVCSENESNFSTAIKTSSKQNMIRKYFLTLMAAGTSQPPPPQASL